MQPDIKSREDVVRLIESGKLDKPHGIMKIGFGLLELRQLLDYIYGGQPMKEEEKLKKIL